MPRISASEGAPAALANGASPTHCPLVDQENPLSPAPPLPVDDDRPGAAGVSSGTGDGNERAETKSDDATVWPPVLLDDVLPLETAGAEEEEAEKVAMCSEAGSCNNAGGVHSTPLMCEAK
jgi:hypothetical protein